MGFKVINNCVVKHGSGLYRGQHFFPVNDKLPDYPVNSNNDYSGMTFVSNVGIHGRIRRTQVHGWHLSGKSY